MYRLVLLRHGESTWNKENRFTGWTDVDLSERGREEAAEAGRLMKAEDFEFDVAHTSLLKRAIRTLWIALVRDGHDVASGAPLVAAQRASLRCAAGPQQSRNGRETRRSAGEDLAAQLRHSAAAAHADDPQHPSRDRRYADLQPNEVPLTESLKDTVARFLPYWHSSIAPDIKAGKRVLIAAHGNSLRALVKYLDRISDEDIVELNIPTGMPLVYELDEQLQPVKKYYLGDQEAAMKKAAAVANQAKGR